MSTTNGKAAAPQSKFAGRRVFNYQHPQGMWMFHPALREGTFNPRMDVPAMMKDHAVAIGLNAIYGPLATATFEVRANSKEIKTFIENTIYRFWHHDLMKVVRSYIPYGTSACETMFEKDADSGLWKYAGLDDFDVFDVQPWKRGRHMTKMRVASGGMGISHGDMQEENPNEWNVVKHPKIFWCAHRPLHGNLRGHSALEASWPSWMEKCGSHGAKSNRKLWAFSNSFRGCIVKYPIGSTIMADGFTRIDNRDIAQEIAENYSTGGVSFMPSGVDENGNALWEIIDPKMNGEMNQLMEYPTELDREIWQGMGVPDEVLHAPDTGGIGPVSRSGPEFIYLSICDMRVLELITAFDVGPSGYTTRHEQAGGVIRPLVMENFGAKAKYEIRAISLVPNKSAEPGAGGTPPGPGGMAPEPGGAPPAGPQPVQLSAAGAFSVELPDEEVMAIWRGDVALSSRDASGHEHKDKGPGGGQFTGIGSDGVMKAARGAADEAADVISDVKQLADIGKGSTAMHKLLDQVKKDLRSFLTNPETRSMPGQKRKVVFKSMVNLVGQQHLAKIEKHLQAVIPAAIDSLVEKTGLPQKLFDPILKRIPGAAKHITSDVVKSAGEALRGASRHINDRAGRDDFEGLDDFLDNGEFDGEFGPPMEVVGISDAWVDQVGSVVERYKEALSGKLPEDVGYDAVDRVYAKAEKLEKTLNRALADAVMPGLPDSWLETQDWYKPPLKKEESDKEMQSIKTGKEVQYADTNGISLSSRDASGHEHKPAGTSEGGQFAGVGADGTLNKAGTSAKPGERAAALHAKQAEVAKAHAALKQAHAELQEERRAVFDDLKEGADAASAKADEHHASLLDLSNKVNNQDDETEFGKAWTELDSLVCDYDPDWSPSGRFEAFKEIEAQAKECLGVKQTSINDKGAKQEVAKLSRESDVMVKEIEAYVSKKKAYSTPGDEAVLKGFTDKNRPHILEVIAKDDAARAKIKELRDAMPEGITSGEIEEDKASLQSIIAHARAARQQLKTYVQHRKEMQSIKEGKSPDVQLSMAMHDDWDGDLDDVSLSATWDEAKHHRGQPGNAGEFGPGGGNPQGGGAAAQPATPEQSKAGVIGRIGARLKATRKGMAETAVAKQAADIYHALHDAGESAFHELPIPMQSAVIEAMSVAFSGWHVSQALAERIAIEKGATPKEAAQTRNDLAFWDLVGFKPVAIATGPLGGAVAAATWIIPPATGAYLLCSIGKHPICTLIAATKLVANFVSAVTPMHLSSATAPTDSQRLILDAIQKHGRDDWYMALLNAAVQKTRDAELAAETADALFAKQPKDVSQPRADDADVLFGGKEGDVQLSAWDESKHKRGQPENAGEFGPGGGKPQGGGAGTKAGTPDDEPIDHAADYAKNGTRSKAFKAWFGDSKIVKANGEPQETHNVTGEGEPIKVFHGTPRQFDSFELDQAGSNIDSGFLGTGFYFTDNQKAAEYYSKIRASNSPTVIPAYLAIKNPFQWGKKTQGVRALVMRGESLPAEIHTKVIAKTGFKYDADAEPDFQAERKLSSAVREVLIELGYDGVVSDIHSGSTSLSPAAKEYVAFEPNQIKAVANQGTFDPASNNIGLSSSDDDVQDVPEFPTIVPKGGSAKDRRKARRAAKRGEQ